MLFTSDCNFGIITGENQLKEINMGIMDKAIAVAGLVKAADNPDLVKAYLDLQSDVYKLWEDLKEKDKTIGRLQEALSLKGKLVCKGSAYFLADEKGGFADGPFCAKCFDVDHNKCRLIPMGSVSGAQVQCPKCKVPIRSTQARVFLDINDRLE